MITPVYQTLGASVDNRWVVRYNRRRLAGVDCHVNIKVLTSIVGMGWG